MARPLRIHAPGVAVHVVSRGDDRRPIFLDPRDYARYLEVLSRGLRRFGVKCHFWCLMGNHLHLVLTPDTQPLARLMQQVNSSYCEWFNAQYGRVGHVLQGRYYARLIEDGSYFLNAVRYLALNPVAAGLVARPEDWPWSSYGALLGLTDLPPYLDVEEVFRLFDAEDEEEMRERLRVFIEAGSAEEDWRASLSGSAEFVRRMEPRLRPHRAISEYSYEQRYATRPALSVVLANHDGPALDAAVATAFLRHAYTLREIATMLDERHPSTIWRWIRRTAAADGVRS